MADWKNPKDYEFVKTLSRDGWVWELLRRNDAYQKDYDSIEQSDRKTLRAAEKEFGKGVRPLFTRRQYIGGKWGLAGDAQNPTDDHVPCFQQAKPSLALLNEIGMYYDTPDDLGQADPLPGFAVLIFNLRLDTDHQCLHAQRFLKSLQRRQGLGRPKRNLNVKQLTTYLRLLDAKRENGTTKDILRYIDVYTDVAHKTTDEDSFQAHKRVARDLKQARQLATNPWGLLR